MGNYRASSVIALCALVTGYSGTCGAAQASNLLTNGDFSGGNTGFSSGYAYAPPAKIMGPGAYAVGFDADAVSVFGDWGSLKDHTTGSGLYLIADGSEDGATVWSETVSVTANTTYLFSFWGATVDNSNDSPAALQPIINAQTGATLGTSALTWSHGVMSWNSGRATSATLSLIDTNFAYSFNDLGVDDVSFSAVSAVPLPASLPLLGAGLLALGGANRLRKRRALAEAR